MRFLSSAFALSAVCALAWAADAVKRPRTSETGEPDGPAVSQLSGECTTVGGPQSVGIFLVNLRNSPTPDGGMRDAMLPAACNARSISEVFFSNDPTSVNGFYREMSRGVAWVTGDVIGVLTIPDPDPQSPQCFAGPKLVQAVDEAARAQGLVFEKYSRRVYITAPRMGCRTAASGGPTASGARVPVSIFGGGCPAASNAAHEIGHTFGLGHSMLDLTFGGGPWGPASQEGGDVMGFSGILTPFNAVHRAQLGWIRRDRKLYIESRKLETGSVTDVFLSPLGAEEGDDPETVIVSFPDGSAQDFHLSFRIARGLEVNLDQPSPSPGISGGPYLDNLSIHWFNRYCPNVYGDETNTVRQRSYLLGTLAAGESFTPRVEGATRKITFEQAGTEARGSLRVRIRIAE